MLFQREETVDEIVKDVSSVVEKLRNRAKRQYQAAGEHLVKASEHHAKREAATDEAGRADRLADKFADLIS